MYEAIDNLTPGYVNYGHEQKYSMNHRPLIDYDVVLYSNGLCRKFSVKRIFQLIPFPAAINLVNKH